MKMDHLPKNSSERLKPNKKMTKAQLHLAIIRKRECDAKAQEIVEKLLEHDVDPQWMLENLQHINKCHMEDVIEERSIEKLCGYALCKKPLTVKINQRYHISTKRNKVYDVSRRKSFCSSYCYGAMNYLLEQMLTSPLWLREEEQIPEFRLLTDSRNSETNNPGEEIIVFKDDSIKKDEIDAAEFECSSYKETEQDLSMENKDLSKSVCKEKGSVKDALIEEENKIEGRKKMKDVKPKKNSVSFQIPNGHKECPSTDHQSLSPEQKIKPLATNDSLVKNVTQRENLTTAIETVPGNSRKESKFQRERKSSKSSKNSKDTLETLVSLVKRIEENFNEWITEETLRLLLGEETTKQQVFDDVTKQEKYAALCQKLNQLQVLDEREDRTSKEKNSSKAIPQYSFLQEEGKKLQLKVRAFYEGRTVVEVPDFSDKNDKPGKDENSSTSFPLTESRAPNAIRRRIFLDMLNNVLPDLLCALSGNGQLLPGRFEYSRERVVAVKALVSTFALTANNIVFKVTEWTLVGLIIIKMLSAIDPGLKYLLSTKQASLYTSMILMSYQLDSHYLDTFLNSIMNTRSCKVDELGS